jgi:hypothetical protein
VNSRVRVAAYAATTMVMAFFVVDLVASLWPMQPGRLEWRYGAGGFLSGSLVTVTFALLIAVAAAATARSRVARRVVGSAAILGAALLLITSGVFALDALQLRARIQPETMTSFQATTARALFKLWLATATWTVMGLTALRHGSEDAGRAHGRSHRAPATAEHGAPLIGSTETRAGRTGERASAADL